MLDLLQQYDFVVMRRVSAKRKHISIGFYAAPPGGTIIGRYAERLRQMLSQSTEFPWGAAGAHALTPIVNDHPDRCYLYPEERLHPIVSEEKHLFREPAREISRFLEHDPLTFMLFHRVFEMPEFEHVTEEELLQGDTVLSEAFSARRAGMLANPQDGKPGRIRRALLRR